jgi:hypothetical protein
MLFQAAGSFKHQGKLAQSTVFSLIFKPYPFTFYACKLRGLSAEKQFSSSYLKQ